MKTQGMASLGVKKLNGKASGKASRKMSEIMNSHQDSLLKKLPGKSKPDLIHGSIQTAEVNIQENESFQPTFSSPVPIIDDN